MRRKQHFWRFPVVCALCAALILPVAAQARELIPMGQAVGIQMTTQGMLVAGLADVETPQGTVSPARDAGFCAGDVICAIDGRKIETSDDFLTALAQAGEQLTVTVLRGGTETALTVTPAVTADGAVQLGLWLRDGVSGVGTVTYCDPATGAYGALGHGITDEDSGVLMPLRTGSIMRAEIADTKRGEAGAPGELIGSFDPGQTIGDISGNCVFGIFGTMAETPEGTPVETASDDAVKTGPAVVRSTVAGDTAVDYAVEISRIYRENGCTRYLLTVTDPALLEATGGIVQGMSGSPILQDGKLIGAVTHVLLNDPTKGYGLSIDSMLRAAEQQTTEAAA